MANGKAAAVKVDEQWMLLGTWSFAVGGRGIEEEVK
jgi:hypothetical protein